MSPESEEFQTIQILAERFSNKTFAYYDKEDIKQEVWVICLESLHKYDPERSSAKLETFLFRVVSNELTNKYNKLFKKVNPPVKCRGCNSDCKSQCEVWSKYLQNVKRIKELQIVTLGIDTND